jgi:hypothetical protein
LREPHITSLKDSGGDTVAATEPIQTDGPTLLNGWDTLTFAALAAGVRAVVWGAASILPERCVELHRLLIDCRDRRAQRAAQPGDTRADHERVTRARRADSPHAADFGWNGARRPTRRTDSVRLTSRHA